MAPAYYIEQTIADNIHEINEFGDLPPSLLKRLSQILSRRRVLNSRTLDLFLRPDLDTIDVYDCGSKFIGLASLSSYTDQFRT